MNITIHYNMNPIYNIYFYESFKSFYELFMEMDIKDKKVCIVTDDNVSKYYLEELFNIVKDYSSEVISFIFTSGEENKNLDTVSNLYTELITHKFDRTDLLIALGGGVTGDLTGFASATYLRGIRFIQVPTSLLSQVDSSIGGKTGVDYNQYKNMVGAFHQPIAVYTNLNTLNTLNDKQYFSGLGEIVKHGLIMDYEYFKWLFTHVNGIIERNPLILKEMIYRSCKIKQAVVELDPEEKNERALLNFGHTLGHSIERLMDFKLLHGECVSIGMVLSSYISFKRGNISKNDYEGIKELLWKFNLPITISGLDPKDIIEVAKSDKKMDSGIIKFIILEKLGKAVIVKDVTYEEMYEAIKANSI